MGWTEMSHLASAWYDGGGPAVLWLPAWTLRGLLETVRLEEAG